MRIDILTLFPEMFAGPFSASIIKRAVEKGLVSINLINFRDFAIDKHKTVDDYPYGGGAGMVLKPEPIIKAYESLSIEQYSRVIMMCPQGEKLDQKKAEELAQADHLVFLCGHYEGFDERIRSNIVTDELSIGDYVLTGGEIPCMVVVDAVTRLIPEVLGKSESIAEESFMEGLLEYPQYTRPYDYGGSTVPDILLSGNHEEIRKWRKKESIRRTLHRRPELLDQTELDSEGREMLEELRKETCYEE